MPTRPKTLGQVVGANKPKRDWHGGLSRHQRGLGTDHDRMRLVVLDEEPLCRECLKQDRTTATEIADHIKPRSEGGTNERENYQGLCRDCHDEKTKREAAAGRRAAKAAAAG